MKKTKVFAIITFIGALSCLGEGGAGVMAAVFFAAIGIVLWKYDKRSDVTNAPPPSVPEKTFSFSITGTRYPCKFPSRYSERQTTISHSHVGDVVLLKEFEWEGETAFAVVNKRLRTDIGVVPKKLLSKVMALVSEYDIAGKITAINTVEIKGDSCKTCDIILDCYKNDALSTKDAPVMVSTEKKTHRFDRIH